MGLNSTQEQEVTFISGVTAGGTVANQAFDTWNGDQPATYAGTSNEAKWGALAAGTGASITVAFDTQSNWSGSEKAAFIADMHLWSAVANITFNVVDGSTADLEITRSDDDAAATTLSLKRPGPEGSTQLGTLTHAKVSIDTSTDGFGPIGSNFSVAGGYPWMTVLHELGHSIGLGHAGAYNEGQTAHPTMLTGDDDTAWSVMSYIAADDPVVSNGPNGTFDWGREYDGTHHVPLTPMLLDILAVERLYGAPSSTPLSGGQIFGFNSNLSGDIRPFFDFTVNSRPIVTLWDAGTHNTLDLSGYSQNSLVSLKDGTLNSVGGLSNNLEIAFGTHIDTVIGGSGDDSFSGNDDGDVLIGGGGNDYLAGGAGNDHIYGNSPTAVQGSTDGDDGISTGGGTNYVNGNAGNDQITVSGLANRIYGGAGDDRITVNSGVNHINGNAGNDTVLISNGTNTVFGGQGNDTVFSFNGNNVLSGDAGNDTLIAGSGVEVMTGGSGNDVFMFDTRQLNALDSPLYRSGDLAGYHDEITDFVHGEDHLEILAGTNDASRFVLHQDGGSGFRSFDDAVAFARNQIGSSTAISVLQVGSDTYVIYDALGGGTVDSAIKLDNVAASQVQFSDFTF